MPTARTYKVSVKKFVDFACRSGDLVHTGPAGPTAQEGQVAHKKLQQQKAPGEAAEVTVSASISRAHQTLKLSGRVDLLQVDKHDAIPRIGEIKSCYAPPERQPASTVALHWAQLKVYGYCVLKQLRDYGPEGIDGKNKSDTPREAEPFTAPLSIHLRLIWINLQSDEMTVDAREFEFAELEEFTLQAADTYLDWMQLISESQKRTRKTAKTLPFPHSEFRDGQRQMAASVYVTTRDKKRLLCEAPTGIGKTVSALFPSIKSLGEKHVDTVLYLTAKNSGRQSANTCIKQLQNAGLALTAITITAKKTTCHCSNGTCERNNDGRCPLTIGFFDRLPQARYELLELGVITPDDVDGMAHKHQLCPFELTLQMLPWVSVVICDYNYVFDPLVRLTHFVDNASRHVLLVDEAHNLAERARSMFSAQLARADFKLAIAECSDQPMIAKELDRIVRAIDRWAKKYDTQENADTGLPETISRAVDKCTDAMTALTENNVALSEKTADVARELFRYKVIADLFGDHHRTITLKPNAGNKRGHYNRTTVQLRCLNATHALSHSFRAYRSSTVFSATLRPQQFSRDSLGLPEDAYCLALESPFPPEHQGTFVCNWIDTRYRAREKSVAPLVKLAAQMVKARPGNYQIFFPSYAFMELVHDTFCQRYPDIPTALQKRGSGESDRAGFLERFNSADSLLAFSILGGIYGEGVDYTGDKLIGAMVVGTGLPSVTLEQKLIEQDYSRQGLNGFDYASRYPGMTRVLQTAGRVIRSDTDKGVVLLVDQRFREPFYQNLYPSHWRINQCKDQEQFRHSVTEFWQSYPTQEHSE